MFHIFGSVYDWSSVDNWSGVYDWSGVDDWSGVYDWSGVNGMCVNSWGALGYDCIETC